VLSTKTLEMPPAAASSAAAAAPSDAPQEPLLGRRSSLRSDGRRSDDDRFYYLDGALHHSSVADERIQEDGRVFRSTFICMRADHPIRACFVHIACHKRLDDLVLLVTLANALDMLLSPQRPLEGSAEAARAALVEHACMGLFSVEMFVRIVAHGLAGHKHAFLHDPWNLFDVLVLAPFWVRLALPEWHAPGALRLLRCFRPLRAIMYAPALRRIVLAFLRSIPALSTIAGLAGTRDDRASRSPLAPAALPLPQPSRTRNHSLTRTLSHTHTRTI
jgi:hypothetical protein